MCLEIDIILGQTEDNIRHLAGPGRNSDTIKHENRGNSKAAQLDGRENEAKAFEFQELTFDVDRAAMIAASNRDKLEAIG